MNPRLEHTVLWDGRRGGVGGAMLYAPESVRVDPPPPDLGYGEATKRIRAFAVTLRDWHTIDQIAGLTGLTRRQVSNPVNTLTQTGVMEREQHGHFGRLVGGPQRYRWKR